jgi:hypothetical protein
VDVAGRWISKDAVTGVLKAITNSMTREKEAREEKLVTLNEN